MSTYRFTCRPACAAHCPDGWTDIRPLVPDRQWNYGEVDYPEPLTQERAEHFSLLPVRDGRAALELWPRLRWECDEYEWRQLFGGSPESMAVLYEYGVGRFDAEDVDDFAQTWAAEYDTAVEVLWP